jgi:plastocyanin
MLRIATILGLLLAAATFVSEAAPSASAAGSPDVIIAVGDFWFCDSSYQNGSCPTTVQTGSVVQWDFSGAAAPHSTRHCGTDCNNPTGTPLWDSGVVPGGGAPYKFTFDTPGVYPYLCAVHPFTMRGEITVEGGVGGVTELSDLDANALESGTSSGNGAAVIATALAAAAATVVAGAAAWYAGLRRRRARL